MKDEDLHMMDLMVMRIVKNDVDDDHGSDDEDGADSIHECFR